MNDRLNFLFNTNLLSPQHVQFLDSLKAQKIEPLVIYDIGACTLDWYNEAYKHWSNSKYYLVDANSDLEYLYKKIPDNYYIGLLGKNNTEVSFYNYEALPHKSGTINANLPVAFKEEKKFTETLDEVVEKNNWPTPDLVKLDTSGTELDVLIGAKNTLQNTSHLIVNLEYSSGDNCITYLKSTGWTLEANFDDNKLVGDFYFTKK